MWKCAQSATSFVLIGSSAPARLLYWHTLATFFPAADVNFVFRQTSNFEFD